MKPQEALNLALSMELVAIEKYKQFANELPEVRETFNFLVSEEVKHKDLLERLIRSLPK
jgi:rubrerythrin